MKQKVLVIGLVWPEPTSSAAGWRMTQLLDFFRVQGYAVHFACAAQKTPASYNLTDDGIIEHHIMLNHSSFDEFIKILEPDVIMFDRFMIEEQYGWRVREVCPASLTILDTEDMHFVRKAREISYKKKIEVDFYTEEAKRELAAILRCDLTLIISTSEMELLINEFKIPATSLLHLPFMHAPLTTETVAKWVPYEERNHIMFIGNFWHEPNYQTVRYLKEYIWPSLKEKLPDAELHIYGSYVSQKVMELHQPKNRFFIRGKAENAIATMSQYRLLLAPIVFGAGLKGKFVDAVYAGLPSVTSTIGAEGLFKENWPGFITDEVEELVERSSSLFQEEVLWKEKQHLSVSFLYQNFDKDTFYDQFENKLSIITEDVMKWRRQHFIGQILLQQQFLASRYLSKWIEEKNK